VSTERRQRAARGRVSAGERARRVLETVGSLSPAEQLARRALSLVDVARPTAREERLLELAEDMAAAANGHLLFRSHTLIYVALASCSWAISPALGERSQNAAILVAVALASTARPNLVEVMGLGDRLRELSRICMNPELALAARVAAFGELSNELDACRVLESVIDSLEESPGAETAVRSCG
jgi:hypothetical protein